MLITQQYLSTPDFSPSLQFCFSDFPSDSYAWMAHCYLKLSMTKSIFLAFHLPSSFCTISTSVESISLRPAEPVYLYL